MSDGRIGVKTDKITVSANRTQAWSGHETVVAALRSQHGERAHLG